jgi:hypothetical protein
MNWCTGDWFLCHDNALAVSAICMMKKSDDHMTIKVKSQTTVAEFKT